MNKIEIVIAVLQQRLEIVEDKIMPNTKDEETKQYYLGKLDGYSQAIELLNSSPESAAIELNT